MSNDKERAKELLVSMKDALEELTSIFRRVGGITWDRAKLYPLAGIAVAIDNDHDYLTREQFTVAELIKDIDNCGEDEERCDECDGILDNDDPEEGCNCIEEHDDTEPERTS